MTINQAVCIVSPILEMRKLRLWLSHLPCLWQNQMWIQIDLVPEAKFLTTMAFHREECNFPPRGIFLSTLGKPMNTLGFGGWIRTELEASAPFHYIKHPMENDLASLEKRKWTFELEKLALIPECSHFLRKFFQKEKKCYFHCKRVIAFLAKASYLLFFWQAHWQECNTWDSHWMSYAVFHMVYFGLDGEVLQHDLTSVQPT